MHAHASTPCLHAPHRPATALRRPRRGPGALRMLQPSACAGPVRATGSVIVAARWPGATSRALHSGRLPLHRLHPRLRRGPRGAAAAPAAALEPPFTAAGAVEGRCARPEPLLLRRRRRIWPEPLLCGGRRGGVGFSSPARRPWRRRGAVRMRPCAGGAVMPRQRRRAAAAEVAAGSGPRSSRSCSAGRRAGTGVFLPLSLER